jgi:hypothetical protein
VISTVQKYHSERGQLFTRPSSLRRAALVATKTNSIFLHDVWHGLGAVPWWGWVLLIGSFILLNVQRVRSKH